MQALYISLGENSTLLFNRRDDIDLRCAELKNDAAMIGSIL